MHGLCLTDIIVNVVKDIPTDVTLSRELSHCDQHHTRELAHSPLALLQKLVRCRILPLLPEVSDESVLYVSIEQVALPWSVSHITHVLFLSTNLGQSLHIQYGVIGELAV